jgi:hypothetical protein
MALRAAVRHRPPPDRRPWSLQLTPKWLKTKQEMKPGNNRQPAATTKRAQPENWTFDALHILSGVSDMPRIHDMPWPLGNTSTVYY